MNEIKILPYYKRQRFLLSFISQLNNDATITDLQKLVFIHSMSSDLVYYEFVPYKFGAYSFQLKHDLDILKNQGFITFNNGKCFSILNSTLNNENEPHFLIAPERGDMLIKVSYQKFPYYSINSKIVERLFDVEELSLFKKVKASLIKSEPCLLTIGYEGRSIERFINTLIKNDVRVVCDVRKNPLSHKFGFSKKKLEYLLQETGILYTHCPELGIESDLRRDLSTADEYKSLFSHYKEKLHTKNVYINNITNLLHIHKRVALMCFEADPETCHRHVIRDYIKMNLDVRSEDI
jgi:uncharacterized protein YwgA/uncharacterized protein YeaO (DUF488 family)